MKTNALQEIVEMVAEGTSVRFVPAQPSFGRTVDTVKVSTGYKAITAEYAARVLDAAAALGVRVTAKFSKVQYARGTISAGVSYEARFSVGA